MVPRVELPPASPLTDQVTAVLNAPVPATLEEHCAVLPVVTEVGEQMTLTAVMVAAGAVMEMVAEPDLVVSWVDVAVMVTGLVVGTVAGAV